MGIWIINPCVLPHFIQTANGSIARSIICHLRSTHWMRLAAPVVEQVIGLTALISLTCWISEEWIESCSGGLCGCWSIVINWFVLELGKVERTVTTMILYGYNMIPIHWLISRYYQISLYVLLHISKNNILEYKHIVCQEKHCLHVKIIKVHTKSISIHNALDFLCFQL